MIRGLGTLDLHHMQMNMQAPGSTIAKNLITPSREPFQLTAQVPGPGTHPGGTRAAQDLQEVAPKLPSWDHDTSSYLTSFPSHPDFSQELF